MKKTLILITFFGLVITKVTLTFAGPGKTQLFTYSYDNAGNRVKRIYTLLNPCPGSPDCLSRKAITDSTIVDSLFTIAQNTELKTPETPTEKPVYDDTPELKNIYPNPTQGLFLMEFTSLILNGSLQILDVKGILLDEIRLDGTQWEIDLSLFPAGEYILLIKTKEGKVYSKKIVKI